MEKINILFTLLILFFSSACYQNTQQIHEIKNSPEKKINSQNEMENPVVFGFKIGISKLQQALAENNNLLKAESSFISFGNKNILMDNTYYFLAEDGSTVFLQFDEQNNILQNILIFGIKKSFNDLNSEFSKLYPKYPAYNLEEFEAFSRGETTFENQEDFLQKHKEQISLFKKGNVVVILGKSIDSKETIVFYRNSSYIPILKEKAKQM